MKAVWYMLVHPVEAYRIIEEKRPLFWPLVIIVLPGLAVLAVLLPQMQADLLQTVAPEVQGEMGQEGTSYLGTVGIISGVIGLFVSVLVVTLLEAGVTALFLALGASAIPFRTLFSLSILSSAPSILQSLLQLLLLSLGLVTWKTLQISTNLAGLLDLDPAAASPWLYTLLVSLDPFTLWGLALFAGGLGFIGKVSPRARWTIAGLLWIIFTVVPNWFSRGMGGPL
ncbi:MAG: YIP1 family protein [Clostridiales bacterium]|nr:YIP1 family protein [Clostridiales bacterium]